MAMTTMLSDDALLYKNSEEIQPMTVTDLKMS